MPKHRVRSGLLQQLVNVQQQIDTLETRGQENDLWLDLVTNVPCEIVALAGRELEGARQLDATVSHRVTLRYVSHLSPQNKPVMMRLMYTDQDDTRRILHIGYIEDVDERNHKLTILATEEDDLSVSDILHRMTATVAAVSSVTADLAVSHALIATVNAVSSVTANISLTRGLTATVAGVSSVTADMVSLPLISEAGILILWLDAEDSVKRIGGSSTAVINNTEIDFLEDMSTYGNHATVDSTSQQPSYFTGGAAPEYIDFDGVDEFLRLGANDGGSTFGHDMGSDDWTVFYVSRFSAEGKDQYQWAQIASGNDVAFLWDTSEEAGNEPIAYKHLGENIAGLDSSAGDWSIHAGRRNGTLGEHWLDGGVSASKTFNDEATIGEAFNIGRRPLQPLGDKYFDGRLGTFLIYTTALSDATMDSVGNLLADKYDITWNNVSTA